jgi:hypothetical protein
MLSTFFSLAVCLEAIVHAAQQLADSHRRNFVTQFIQLLLKIAQTAGGPQDENINCKFYLCTGPNYLETLWMKGFLFLWVVFLITAEIARFGQPFSLTRAPYGSRIARLGSLGPLQGARE